MSATWSVRWLDLARQDHADILRWTALHFGRRQAEIYTETIALALEALDTGPDIPGGVQRDDLAPGSSLCMWRGTAARAVISSCSAWATITSSTCCGCCTTAWTYRVICRHQRSDPVDSNTPGCQSPPPILQGRRSLAATQREALPRQSSATPAGSTSFNMSRFVGTARPAATPLRCLWHRLILSPHLPVPASPPLPNAHRQPLS